MPASALLISLSLLAASATADYCSNASIGNLYGYALNYEAISVNAKTPTGIIFNNFCQTRKQGLYVSACAVDAPPSLQVLSLDVAQVYSTSPATVYATEYCTLFSESNIAHSEKDILPLIGGALPAGGSMRPKGGVPIRPPGAMPLNVGAMPWVEAAPGAGAVPVREPVLVREPVPVREAPAERYHQHHWD